ncbi:IMP-specific 5'-nucleotidase-like protein 1 [Xylona heveae TC161]|uniref:IMP-specific 5'-nucleotidase 1 n=1 Tax=Xylona heveae (strain CBS 132557 / TC161) TaxID=1328760 RepID=A0A165GWP4_XYLHT|nr:IMP-specific 5'-nucleotidase-like protein 1 [Xylona heveae TC161]KZF22694.1 IMP-specific 5'-nucleotidase-like protein 1 [Xylona heveae TC161]
MTTRYRVEYALKTHRRDQFIEWVKGLLAVPFVLHSQPTAIFEDRRQTVAQMAAIAHRRYAEIMGDVEELINDHIAHQNVGKQDRSKLKLLVPSVGTFFTPLPLKDAFIFQDAQRSISSRRFVAPSFNDIRLTLNTAQLMSLSRNGPLQLATFDGDVTLYDDGESLSADNPVIPRILRLMQRGVKIGIVTAAGYTEAGKYFDRLSGLLNAVNESKDLSAEQKRNLVVLGGEDNYLFRFNANDPALLSWIPHEEWLMDEMKSWKEEDIGMLLDLAESALKDCIASMNLKAQILRKGRAVGIIPAQGQRFAREQLEETVLVTQKILEMSEVGQRIPFCAFNGGNDIFVDIGDKSWGVLSCQRFFGGIEGSKSLHIGDQFLSAGANDFKARLACTTAWIANPLETVQLLDELEELGECRQLNEESLNAQ